MDEQANDLLRQALRAFEAGQIETAAAGFEAVLDRAPDSAEALYFLAVIHYRHGRHDTALPLVERAAAIQPGSEDCHNLHGLLLLAQGRPQHAILALRRAVACNPAFPDAHNSLGAAHEAAGEFEAAEECFRQATVVEARYAHGFSNLSRILLATGRPAEAEEACRSALSVQPEFPDARFNLAIAQHRQAKLEAAMATLEIALASAPDNADLWRFMGVLRHARGDLSGGEAALAEAIRLQAGLAEAHDNLAGILLDQGRVADAEASFRRALACDPESARVGSNLLLCRNYSETDPQALFEAHLDWAARRGTAKARTAGREISQRLRIGYVSGDFRRHSVAYFFEPLLQHRDAARFETFCYANLENPDAVTDRLRTRADHWRWVAGLTDSHLAARIRQDQIDILIDLSGHTAGNRLPVFHRKPAPVQATWLGYPNTTGLAAIDYRVTDTLADPDGAERHATEALVRLENGFLCFNPPDDAPEVAPPPGQRNGYVTFGSFNNLRKTTGQTIATWSEILDRVAGSKLLLKARPLADPATAKRFRAQFAAHGIESDRLILRGAVSGTTDHLAAYAEVDIALDPFPYNGTTTTCEALWMGVPVITLLGNRHASRVGASLLTQTCLTELIGAECPDYIETAVRLAQDMEGLAELRKTLRDRMARSSLCDGAGFCRRMERAFERMWRNRPS